MARMLTALKNLEAKAAGEMVRSAEFSPVPSAAGTATLVDDAPPVRVRPTRSQAAAALPLVSFV